MATIADLKKGDKFIARKGQSVIHGVAHTDFFVSSRFGGGYVNIKIDGINYGDRTNQSFYMNDGWEIEIKLPTAADIIAKFPLGTRFTVEGVGYIKVGEGVIVNDGVKLVRDNIRAYRPEEFGDRPLKVLVIK